MMKIAVIAVNTFREAVRDKILYTLLFFTLLMMGVSTILDYVTIGQHMKIIKDMGLASINIFGVLIAIFVGINLVYKEIDRRTIYTLISKPLHRYEFLLGKYLGLVLTLCVEVGVMGIFFLLLVFVHEGTVEKGLLAALFLILVELMTITAVAILFSSFSTPILSGMFTLAVYVIGHLTADLKDLGVLSKDPALERVTAFLYYILPNLENFNIKGQVVYQIPVPLEQMALSLLYGVLYMMLLLLLSVLIFQKRDFR